jgi:hypothetical protein
MLNNLKHTKTIIDNGSKKTKTNSDTFKLITFVDLSSHSTQQLVLWLSKE